MFKNFNDQPGRDFAPREMVKGNWNCSECQKEITELPFAPSEDRPIFCKDCWAKKRAQRFSR
ncbi:MAG: CxxC-x17-CxxC domain-containing protein [bacterium]